MRWRLELEVVPGDAGSEEEPGIDAAGTDPCAPPGAAADAVPGWCTRVFTAMRSTSRLPRSGAAVEWCGWRAEPFMFGAHKMVVLIVLHLRADDGDGGGMCGEASAADAADEVTALAGSLAELVQGAHVTARSRLADDGADDALATCRRLFVPVAEAEARVDARDLTAQAAASARRDPAATASRGGRILTRAHVRSLLDDGFVILETFVPPAVAVGAARLVAASLSADTVVQAGVAGGGPVARADAQPAGSDCAPQSEPADCAPQSEPADCAPAPLPSGDTRPLRWRWPEPRTARGDCVAWVDTRFASHVPDALAKLPALQPTSPLAPTASDVDGGPSSPPARAGAAAPAADFQTVPAADFQTVLARLAALQAELLALAADRALVGEREVQAAYYAPNGCGYRRHTDALPTADGGGAQRKVSAVVYCNGGWVEAHGGALRVTLQDHRGGGTVDVPPRAGRCVLFLSGCVQHEVRPSFAPRYALTAWYW